MIDSCVEGDRPGSDSVKLWLRAEGNTYFGAAATDVASAAIVRGVENFIVKIGNFWLDLDFEGRV